MWPQLSSLTSSRLIVHQISRRFYHPVKGIFGNTQPYRLNIDEWSQNQQVDNGLPLSYSMVKQAFQKRGHLLCQLDPLSLANLTDVDPITDSNNNDFHQFTQKLSPILGVNLEKFLDSEPVASSVDKKEFIHHLFNMYCRNIGFEFDHVLSFDEKTWFAKQIEREHENPLPFDNTELVAKDLLITEALDHFLARKFQSVKRYGCEGAETMIIFIDELLRLLQQNDQSENGDFMNELIIGMPHRGRLNLLVNKLQYPAKALFHKLSGRDEFDFQYNNRKSSTMIIGDVLSHLYTQIEFEKNLVATLLPNPSHLEVVAPMVCGYSRGQMMHKRIGPYSWNTDDVSKFSNILPLQIHGDASFTGQGIIMETLALANVEHYMTNGSIHLVVNNQVGYTTPGRMYQSRSSLYCTDPLKMINAPIIHVNGDHPDLVARAARLAYNYRQKFRKDVAINLVCYRRWGHNELDDPTFTNPKMYEKIHSRKSIPRSYAEKIEMSQEKITAIIDEYNQMLNDSLTNVNEYKPPSVPVIISNAKSLWKDVQWPSSDHITRWDTSVPEALLKHIGRVSTQSPNDWNLHKTLKKVFDDRSARFNSGKNLDWSLAETLAFGSLLYQGYDVRISGQDVGRGTFSQRHCMIVDQSTNDVHVPLNDLANEHQDYLPWKNDNIGQLEVCNSILSEEAVMAYEYGLSLTTSNVLAIWEAQFGDFFNGAQTIIDTLVSSGEGKWLLQSSLTLLLPNGYDGAGPEHTSARLERFLQISNSSETEIDSDNVNWSIIYPTTPAQYFHSLRRQMIRPYRKPLVVMGPKMLLRHPRCQSNIEDLSMERSHFAPVLDDPVHYMPTHCFQIDPIDMKNTVSNVKSIIFCSGKHYYTLEKQRQHLFGDDQSKLSSIAIVRIEELCPFPAAELVAILKRYPNAKNLIWSQEEHRNMGAWTFIRPRFQNILHQTKLQYVGRGHLEAPAVGLASVHRKEIDTILTQTFDLCQLSAK
ncbi:2-oxoadipate dehydrogenase complex component E1 [Dermatophagoides farinae]|uniref:2-oxoadipate dehydrogenase complex component E1 n=1 Tax=Dermatophagoides farinae TaxID=6954 RepID=UPI003F5F76DB